MRKLNSLSSVHDGTVVSRKIVNDSNLQKQLNESHVIYLQTILASNSINIHSKLCHYRTLFSTKGADH